MAVVLQVFDNMSQLITLAAHTCIRGTILAYSVRHPYLLWRVAVGVLREWDSTMFPK